jgi:hypothetical protein
MTFTDEKSDGNSTSYPANLISPSKKKLELRTVLPQIVASSGRNLNYPTGKSLRHNTSVNAINTGKKDNHPRNHLFI